MTDEYNPVAKFLRLKTGDDIVSEVVETGENDKLFYLLINPVKVVYLSSSKPGYMQVAFTPWVFSRICDAQEFTISVDDVLTISDVSESMNEYYWNQNVEEKEEEITEESTDIENLKEILEQLGLETKRTFH